MANGRALHSRRGKAGVSGAGVGGRVLAACMHSWRPLGGRGASLFCAWYGYCLAPGSPRQGSPPCCCCMHACMLARATSLHGVLRPGCSSSSNSHGSSTPRGRTSSSRAAWYACSTAPQLPHAPAARLLSCCGLRCYAWVYAMSRAAPTAAGAAVPTRVRGKAAARC